ncbi:IMP cyclohydrolase [Candidatus Woesearchaeota archaeon]|nr:IMP cyclohydrolase [Candidatus Woesearchaeota archaeon]
MDLVKIENVIISVYDKRGVSELAKELVRINPSITIISSGGTFRELQKSVASNLVDVSEYTGFPEMPGGLVKTLHPKVHGGILGNEEQVQYMSMHGIKKIDLVVVNLYPFRAASEKGSFEEARTNIDIGGVSLIEAACKNFLRVAVISDHCDYDEFLDELKQLNGCSGLSTRLKLAKKAISRLSDYLSNISIYFQKLNIEEVKK